jgi:tetratricopeptide (TPR) repeat protein
VQPVLTNAAEPRFGMLEMIREYAQERLEAAGQASELGHRHVDWCLALAHPISPRPVEPHRIARLEPDHDNMRAALRRAIDGAAAHDAQVLAAALWLPWYVRGLYGEGRAWLAEVLALKGADVASPTRAHVLLAAGHLAFSQGDFDSARTLLDAALQMADQVGNQLLRGACLHIQASVSRWRGDLASARLLYASARVIFRECDDQPWEATSLALLAAVLNEQGDLTAASAHAEESLRLFEDTGNRWGQARALFVLGRIATQRGDRVAAQTLHETSLAFESETATDLNLARSYLALADVVRDTDGTRTRQLLIDSLMLAEKSGDRLTLARGLERLAGVESDERPERAVRLAAAAETVRARLGAFRQPAEDQHAQAWLHRARGALGGAAYAAAWAAGGTLSVAHCVVEAVQLAGE